MSSTCFTFPHHPRVSPHDSGRKFYCPNQIFFILSFLVIFISLCLKNIKASCLVISLYFTFLEDPHAHVKLMKCICFSLVNLPAVNLVSISSWRAHLRTTRGIGGDLWLLPCNSFMPYCSKWKILCPLTFYKLESHPEDEFKIKLNLNSYQPLKALPSSSHGLCSIGENVHDSDFS